MLDGCQNIVEYGIKVVVDLAIGEPNDADAERTERIGADIVVGAPFFGGVLIAVDFHHQSFFGAVKVDYVAVNTGLKSKFETTELAIAKRRVQFPLLRRRPPPQFTSPHFHVVSIKDDSHQATIAQLARYD